MSEATFAQWWEAARPHTWANAFAPVIAGSGVAFFWGGFSWWRALLATGVAWALIIGVNYANDYSDGIKGTDDDRTGPLRLTGSGLAAPASVKRAAFISFGVAGVFGIALSLASYWWLILVGLLCILAAWFYTGGSRPYGYRGLGEVAVFTFFGLVAVCGTELTQTGRISWAGFATSIAVGSISAAVNLANNLRDIPSDTASGKITLAVRLGDAGTRRLWLALASMPLVVSIVLGVCYTPLAFVGLIAGLLLLPASRPITSGAVGPALIPVLGLTGRAMLAWALLTAGALTFG